MNLNLSQWDKIKDIEQAGFINISVKELYNLISFDGGMWFKLKANCREEKFINKFYNYGCDKMKLTNTH